MPSHQDTYDKLIQAANPVPGNYSDEQIDDALRDFRAQLDQAHSTELAGDSRRPRKLRPRVGFALAAGLAVVAAGFALINVLPGSTSPVAVSRAFAKQVIARATAAATGPGGGVLRVKEVNNMRSSLPGGVNATTETESWFQQTPPYSYWSTTGARTTVVVGNKLEYYNADSNLLYEGRVNQRAHETGGGWYDDGYRGALSVLRSSNGTYALHGQRLPRTLGGLIALILRTPGLTVQKGVSVNGTPAISISEKSTDLRHPGAESSVTLFVQPGTYKPLQFVDTGGVTAGGGNGTTTHTTSWTLTWATTFASYEVLPKDSVSPPNLRELHPSATRAHHLSDAVLYVGKKYVSGNTNSATQTQTASTLKSTQ